MAVSVLIVTTTNTLEIDMRQVSKSVITAFLKGESKTVGNTRTDGLHLFLHGNLIAYKSEDGFLSTSLAGWNTPTTRERLNSLLFLAPQYGYKLDINAYYQHGFMPYILKSDGTHEAIDSRKRQVAATLKGVLVS